MTFPFATKTPMTFQITLNNVIGTVFIKGFENVTNTQPIPIIAPIIKKSDCIPIPSNENTNQPYDMKMSGSYMKIKMNKYSY